jgi:ribosomal protein S18 acetylase RimI-like enzyme
MTAPARPRRATAADLPLLERAELDYIRAVEPAHEARWTAALDRNRALWADGLGRTTVLERAPGDVVGLVMWAEVGGAATVVTVQVLPPHRRQGHGRTLLDLVAEDARAHGHRRLALGVHAGNPGAVALYDGAGWTRCGTDGDYLLYERDLRG